jgi:hypothetical protein
MPRGSAPAPVPPGGVADPAAPLDAAALREWGAAIGREAPPLQPFPGLVLMAVDPFRLHAYWNLDPAELAAARSRFSGTADGRLVLRFREVLVSAGPGPASSAGGLAAFDREVRGASGALDVSVWGRGAAWEAELGICAVDGGWFALTRSRAVRLPPPGPAPVIRYASERVARLVRGAAATPTEEAPASQSRPAAPADPSLRNGGPEPLTPMFPESAPAPRSEPSLESLPVLRPEVPPAPLALAHPRADGAAAPGWSAWSGSADLQLRAELHLYGWAAPDRELILLGQRIPVAPDGRFHWRQPLATDPALLTALARLLAPPGDG